MNHLTEKHRCRLLVESFTQRLPALFLDRDGVIIEDCHHICETEQVRLCRGALELISLASHRGWPVVIITNQSGIARGLLNWEDYERVTERMLALLGPEAPIAAIYACGDSPDAPADSWRKPSPLIRLDARPGRNWSSPDR